MLCFPPAKLLEPLRLLASLVGYVLKRNDCAHLHMKERGGQEMPPPQEAHIISNIQGMDMGRVRPPRLPLAHITPSHKQPMRHKPDSWLSSGIWQCATFENYGPLSFGGGPLFCPGKLTMQSLSKDMVHLCLLRL